MSWVHIYIHTHYICHCLFNLCLYKVLLYLMDMWARMQFNQQANRTDPDYIISRKKVII